MYYSSTQAFVDGVVSIIDETNIKKDKGIHVHVDDDLTYKTIEPSLIPETCIQNGGTCIMVEDDLVVDYEVPSLGREIENKGTYIDVEDDSTDEDDKECQNKDADMFQEMTFALEFCKVLLFNP